MITAKADVEELDEQPVDCVSEIESDTESKYSHSDTTDEEDFNEYVFGISSVPYRGVRTRGGRR